MSLYVSELRGGKVPEGRCVSKGEQVAGVRTVEREPPLLLPEQLPQGVQVYPKADVRNGACVCLCFRTFL